MPVLHSAIEPTHQLPGVRFTSLATPKLGTQETSVWRVEIAPGTLPTAHEVTREELFIVTAGVARVRLGAELSQARMGDVVVVPRGVEFELSAEGTAPLEALCCFPVGGQARLPNGQAFTPPWAEWYRQAAAPVGAAVRHGVSYAD